jgi:hypothetical protein
MPQPQISIVPIDLKPVPLTVQLPNTIQRAPNQPPPAVPPQAAASAVPPSAPDSMPFNPPTLIRPRPIKTSTDSSGGRSKVVAAALVVSAQPETGSKNEKMITQTPGRQDARNYPVFAADPAEAHRSCVVSGMERRRTVDASGVETYQGILPTFRMVVSEVTDVPAWHPMESGCVISITHRRDPR